MDILAGVVGAEAALAALERSAAASVVFIGSTASMEFFNGPRPYGAGKAAMRTYARELGEVWGRKGIRVNVVSLGSIDFPGSVWERVKASDPERYARVLHTIPLGRYGRPSPVPICSRGGPLRTRDFSPTLEAVSHLLTVSAADNRCRRGRKCWAIGPYADRKRWACPADLNPCMRYSRWRVGRWEFSQRLLR